MKINHEPVLLLSTYFTARTWRQHPTLTYLLLGREDPTQRFACQVPNTATAVSVYPTSGIL